MAVTFAFTHVRLLVSDLKACFRFYRDVLEFDVLWGDEEGSYASFKTDRTILALFKRQAMAEVIGSADKPSHVDCQDRVALIFEVDVAYQQLRDKGITFVTEPLDRPDWGIRTAHFRDPDGNLIEIYNNLDA